MPGIKEITLIKQAHSYFVHLDILFMIFSKQANVRLVTIFDFFLQVHSYTGDFEAFANYFMEDLLWWSPYWDFVIDAWNKRNHPNVCLNFFEDMKKDLPSVISKTADFLGKQAADEQVSCNTRPNLLFTKNIISSFKKSANLHPTDA